MSIDNQLMKSLCDHPASGPKLMKYLVTGEVEPMQRWAHAIHHNQATET